jgi:DNA repair exonuclease SbcCD nuclease subunit
MKVLVIGDTHFDNQFPGYLDAQHQTLEKIVKTSQPDAVIFLGDIFHHRNPDPEVLVKTWHMVKRLEDQDIEMVIMILLTRQMMVSRCYLAFNPI